MTKHALAKWIGTFGGVGLSPKAPGTVGTLAALPFAWVLHQQLGAASLVAAAVIAFVIGTWAADVYSKEAGKLDPKEVVIDEVAAMWLVLGAMPLHYFDVPREIFFYTYAVAFVAFRFFDIVKPWPISWADQKIKGGFGIMFDDILAAILALVAIGILGHAASYFGIVHIPVAHG